MGAKRPCRRPEFPLHSDERQLPSQQPPWRSDELLSSIRLIGRGGESGEALLGALAGEQCDGVLASTMSLDAAWLLATLGVRPETPAVIACHHPVKCWAGAAADRRSAASGAVPGFRNACLVFPPFCDAPDKLKDWAPKREEQAYEGLLGCVHPKV